MTAQTPAGVLAAPVGGRIRVSEGLSGFGGLHGGLALALLTSAMDDLVDGRALRSATAQFLRPVRDEAAVRAWVLRHGRVMSATEATAGVGDECTSTRPRCGELVTAPPRARSPRPLQ
jgi:acyl-CoA thioesterase